MKYSHIQHIQHRLSTHINRCFNPYFLSMGETKSSLFHGFKHASRLPRKPFCWKSKDPFRDIRKKNIAFLIFYAHNPAISSAPFQKSWASPFHHLPRWEQKTKNNSDNTLHCSFLFTKKMACFMTTNSLLDRSRAKKAWLLGVGDMTRKKSTGNWPREMDFFHH